MTVSISMSSGSTGCSGVQRLRPGSPVKFASRRFAPDESPRQPLTLERVPVEGFDGLAPGRILLEASRRARRTSLRRRGALPMLGENGFGPRSATDLIFVEVNLNEMARYVTGREET